MSSFNPWPIFEKKVHKIQERFDIVNSHGLAWAKWTSIIVVFHSKGQSLTVLPFSCFYKKKGPCKEWMEHSLYVWGVDHTSHVLAYVAVMMWKVVGRRLFLNVIPNNFTATTGQKVCCDWAMRNWSHQPVQTLSVGNCGCNNVKSGGRMSISQCDPQQFLG